MDRTRQSLGALRAGMYASVMAVVRELEGGSIHLRPVERMIAERAVPPLWPEEERERLFALLSGMIFKDLVELYREVAGGGAPELPADSVRRAVGERAAFRAC